MSTRGTGVWGSLERSSPTAFLIAGAIFVVDAAIVAAVAAGGPESLYTLGQGFVGAGWMAAFVGLLGLYPGLTDRSRWLVRAGTVFTAIGAVTVVVMAVASFGYVSGVLDGQLGDVTMYFLPGVFVGIVLGFGSLGVASLLTGAFSRNLGLLSLLLPVTFLFNLGTGIAGFNPPTKVLGVVCVLALAMGTIGYLLRAEAARADRQGVETSSEPAA